MAKKKKRKKSQVEKIALVITAIGALLTGMAEMIKVIGEILKE